MNKGENEQSRGVPEYAKIDIERCDTFYIASESSNIGISGTSEEFQQAFPVREGDRSAFILSIGVACQGNGDPLEDGVTRVARGGVNVFITDRQLKRLKEELNRRTDL